MTTLAPQAVTRQFFANGRTFPDPDPAMTPDQVRLFYAQANPDLLNATVEGGDFDGAAMTYAFRRAVHTKG
jgi:PRTRC genetic system protein C